VPCTRSGSDVRGNADRECLTEAQLDYSVGLLSEKYFSEEAPAHELNVSTSSEARSDPRAAPGPEGLSPKEITDELLAEGWEEFFSLREGREAEGV